MERMRNNNAKKPLLMVQTSQSKSVGGKSGKPISPKKASSKKLKPNMPVVVD